MNHILVSRFFVDHKQVEIEGRVGGTGRVVGGGGAGNGALRRVDVNVRSKSIDVIRIVLTISRLAV